jgi:hypothetical protein
LDLLFLQFGKIQAKTAQDAGFPARLAPDVEAFSQYFPCFPMQSQSILPYDDEMSK